MSIMQFSIFIFMPLFLMLSMIFIPTFLGNKIYPSFTNKKSVLINSSEKELFNLLTDYENYPNWLKYLSSVNTKMLSDGKLKIVQVYKRKKNVRYFLEVRREKASLISIVHTEDEYSVLWSYLIHKENENFTRLTLKETMYVYHPYLRFMLKYILRDESSKRDMFRRIKYAIKLKKEYHNAEL